MLGLGNSIITSSPLAPSGVTLNYKTNLIGWWDFSDASQMYVEKDSYTTQVASDGDSIGRIKNKAETTPLGNFLRATLDSERPLYKTGGSNGHSYALFDGTNDHLYGKKGSDTSFGAISGSTFSDAEVAQNAITIFVVLSFTNALASGNEKIIAVTGRDAGGGVNSISVQRTADEFLQFYAYSHDDPNDTMFYNDTTWGTSTTLATGVWETGTNKGVAYKNGTADINNRDTIQSNNTMLFNGNSLDGVLIGENMGHASGPSGYNLPGSLYEALVFNEALSDTNRQIVEAYLNTKYSIY